MIDLSNGIAVDAAHSMKRKKTEFRGVDLSTGEVIFYKDIGNKTINIGEFLAIVQACKYIIENDYEPKRIFSDSQVAISWFKNKEAHSKKRERELEKALIYLRAAYTWVDQIEVVHWNNKSWGEIPADFGNKKTVSKDNPMDIKKQLIKSARWNGLFITEMGWNNPKGQRFLPPICVDGTNYSFEAIAQRNGFHVFECKVTSIPNISERHRISLKLQQQANDHIVIYTLPQSDHHLWVCSVMGDKRETKAIEYLSIDQSDWVLSRLDAITFGVNELTTIIDVRQRVIKAFTINVNSYKMNSELQDTMSVEFSPIANGILEAMKHGDDEGVKAGYVEIDEKIRTSPDILLNHIVKSQKPHIKELQKQDRNSEADITASVVKRCEAELKRRSSQLKKSVSDTKASGNSFLFFFLD